MGSEQDDGLTELFRMLDDGDEDSVEQERVVGLGDLKVPSATTDGQDNNNLQEEAQQIRLQTILQEQLMQQQQLLVEPPPPIYLVPLDTGLRYPSTTSNVSHEGSADATYYVQPYHAPIGTPKSAKSTATSPRGFAQLRPYLSAPSSSGSNISSSHPYDLISGAEGRVYANAQIFLASTPVTTPKNQIQASNSGVASPGSPGAAQVPFLFRMQENENIKRAMKRHFSQEALSSLGVHSDDSAAKNSARSSCSSNASEGDQYLPATPRGTPRAKKLLKKGAWDPQEDKQLLDIVLSNGETICWAKVAEGMPFRSAKQCRERFTLNVDPRINHNPFSEEEDAILLAAYGEFGPRWARIKQLLPGRTENSTKTRFKSLMRSIGKGTSLPTGLLAVSSATNSLNQSFVPNSNAV